MKPKPIINWQKIKRDQMKTDMGLDNRFITKVVKSKTIYSRKSKIDKDSDLDD